MSAATYTLTYDLPAQCAAITCHACGLASYSPRDVAERYCGHCHYFHDSPTLPDAHGLRALFAFLDASRPAPRP